MSIIIPAYNEELFIGRLLESIKNAKKRLFDETGDEIEIIVVNNDSSDQTAEIAESYGAKVINENIHNISKVRNHGFKNSIGEVVIFLDADNIISENSLVEISKTMKTKKYIGGGTRFEWDRHSFFYYSISLSATIISKIIGVTGVMIYTYRDIFEEMGGFNEQFFCGEDLLFVRTLKKIAKEKKLKYKNIFNAKVITSARRFSKMTFKDLVHFSIILLKPSLMKIQNNCHAWYSLKKR